MVEEEMRSGTHVNQDDFKTAVEIFRNRLEVVEAQIKQSKQSKGAQAAELFEAARVRKAMVFDRSFAFYTIICTSFISVAS